MATSFYILTFNFKRIQRNKNAHLITAILSAPLVVQGSRHRSTLQKVRNR